MDAKFTLLSGETKKLLRKAGFSSARQALALGPAQLAKELEISLQDALKLVDELKQTIEPPRHKIENAFDLIANLDQAGVRHITTLCRTLDNILDGGFARGAVTELCGAPGAGKTQLCIQAAVNVSIPESLNGLAGEALYLDTEGSFSPQRAFDMAEALTAFLADNLEDPAEVPTTDQVLGAIHVARAHDAAEQIAFVQNLSRHLSNHPKIRVIVIDSVAHHFRHDFSDAFNRGKLLARMAQTLNSVANDFDVAVIVTNHMTTRPDQGLVPALGEQWYHGVTNRIVLTKLEETVAWRHPKKKNDPNAEAMIVPIRRAEIVKASALQSRSADFVVVNIGIRSLPKRHDPSEDSKRMRASVVEQQQ